MTLNRKQEKFLRALAHDLKPVVWLGQQGLTENVLVELDSALEHHELIKVKIRMPDRASRDEVIERICEKTSGTPVQKIGNCVTLYRPNRDNPAIMLPRG